MRASLLSFVLLLGAGCGATASQCPAVDEAALADRVAQRVVALLAEAGEPPSEGAPAPPPSPPRAQRPVSSGPRLRVPVDGAPCHGPPDALVTIVTFSDFECPFCGRANPAMERLLREHPGDVRVCFRHFPLGFHPHAYAAAQAAVAAQALGGEAAFWRMHDLLFAHRDALTDEDLARYAGEVGVDVARFRQALDDGTYESRVDAEVALGRRIGVSGTPAFYFNGHPLTGARPYGEFEAQYQVEARDAAARVAAGTPRAELYTALLGESLDEPPEDAE